MAIFFAHDELDSRIATRDSLQKWTNYGIRGRVVRDAKLPALVNLASYGIDRSLEKSEIGIVNRQQD